MQQRVLSQDLLFQKQDDSKWSVRKQAGLSWGAKDSSFESPCMCQYLIVLVNTLLTFSNCIVNKHDIVKLKTTYDIDIRDERLRWTQ